MFTGQFVPVSAVFVGLAVVTSGLGHASQISLSLVWARRFVFLFLLCGTITLTL
ncbi:MULTISPECIES: hypothetical protein [Haloferax]|uniref:hypothetical protein n=1 Tax=Haloferax TaxID=2251 RepID=UPI000325E555|nr:hypothetical protein [Haloferax mediterranei]MDX5990312.1 hypothetical protein [Haloferax mediterranei ATCC 33500]